DEPTSSERIWWDKNQRMEPAAFERLANDVKAHLTSQELFTEDLFAGADPAYRLPVRFVTPNAWHALFVRNMFIRPEAADLAGFTPRWTVLHAPEFQADPARYGVRTGTVIALNFAQRLVVICGTRYAGEMKKTIFTVMNYVLPQENVLTMHCSANIGPDGDTAIFFGLSGTGKTTLSADPSRELIGDDEHGWSDHGVFNIEGGCYAKVIRLRPDTEPAIYGATRMFGTVLENVELDPVTREVQYDSQEITENTRACYPIHFIANHVPSGQGGIPRNIVLLTADAYGVMPPIARLTPDQAMYHFLSGYTAKVAGTEKGVTEPTATFSACFGAPFLPLHPGVYARMLGEKIRQYDVRVWLVNTGWTGGAYGSGSRMKLPYTRAMVAAALAGKLDNVATTTDPVFGLAVPNEVPGVPSDVLSPRNTWKDPAAYDAQAKKLAGMFRENFQQYADGVPESVAQAGPKA
ncbi:MAG TPA: phosphoenolpyruvate carboxykinase (ATP), partial [Gemmatimonadales bacterium]|nr:phosphoenolpyruvate carboxykinase (ATP) [Gemmatimonadales bacterium]